jgi:hypothetical protein
LGREEAGVIVARKSGSIRRPTARDGACRIILAASLLSWTIVAVDAAAAAEAAKPEMSPEARPVESFNPKIFRPDPSYEDKPYNYEGQIEIYGGKRRLLPPRPLLELGRPQYTEGPFQPSSDIFGEKNRAFNQFSIYGDVRTALAYNDNGDKEIGQVAWRINLDIDYRFTATERVHAFVRPIDNGNKFTRAEFFGDDADDSFTFEENKEFETLYFEGDAGAIVAGLSDEYQKWDLPFTFGRVPLFFQNGIWVDDAWDGAAVTIPARNVPALDISNMDVTLFMGLNNVENRAILNDKGNVDDDDLKVYGITAFIDASLGYYELGYAYTDGRGKLNDQSYHAVTAAFTRRYGGWLSNSVRLFGDFGQDVDNGQETVDGYAVIVENSLVTSLPTTLVPYFNVFAGWERPQPLSRGADGLLKNVGINFETDALTGFPKLDDTANDTFGGAIGVEYLFQLDQQIVVEAATVQVHGDSNGRPAQDDQYALGVRWQKPVTDAWIVRADAMYGVIVDDADVLGMRFEVRRKF